MKILQSRIFRTAAVAVGSTALTMMMATSASASNQGYAYGKNGLGYGYFESYGDYFYINDTKADGHSAVLVWQASGGRVGDEWDKDGANNGWTKVNRNLPEEDSLQYKVCWGEWSTQYINHSSCGAWEAGSVSG
ncbi:hypothetical protein ACH4KN_32530 [Streptomyces sp. NPDC017546]|uniref:hypothetical protein n=1 Tax=unclassified Streptomyces TaxID=2593676 RepID=UPI00235F8373|nr:hypothetical protein [Streptomyces sp. MMBL 11-1]